MTLSFPVEPSSGATRNSVAPATYPKMMTKFLLWCILLVLCWPLALLAIFLYPLVWTLLIPFRLASIAVDAILRLLHGLVTLPGRILVGPRSVDSG